MPNGCRLACLVQGFASQWVMILARFTILNAVIGDLLRMLAEVKLSINLMIQ